MDRGAPVGPAGQRQRGRRAGAEGRVAAAEDELDDAPPPRPSSGSTKELVAHAARVETAVQRQRERRADAERRVAAAEGELDDAPPPPPSSGSTKELAAHAAPVEAAVEIGRAHVWTPDTHYYRTPSPA